MYVKVDFKLVFFHLIKVKLKLDPMKTAFAQRITTGDIPETVQWNCGNKASVCLIAYADA